METSNYIFLAHKERVKHIIKWNFHSSQVMISQHPPPKRERERDRDRKGESLILGGWNGQFTSPICILKTEKVVFQNYRKEFLQPSDASVSDVKTPLLQYWPSCWNHWVKRNKITGWLFRENRLVLPIFLTTHILREAQ